MGLSVMINKIWCKLQVEHPLCEICRKGCSNIDVVDDISAIETKPGDEP